jgi:ParB-like chromosome segregation protein Spo0J
MKPKIEHIEIESLIPYARNSRTHSDAQVAQIAASIKEFGFTNPVLIDQKGVIIAGHGRVMAARKLKLAEVPCIRLGYLTDTQKRAYVIADNKLALNAGWDNEMLKVEFSDLGELNYNLELTGFDLQEIANILDDQDDIEEPEGVGYKEVFNIIVECSSEEEQEKIFNRLDTEGYKCRVQSL